MAKEKAPAMPFYIREYWGDLNVQAMTWEQRGIYDHLIFCCWTEGSIPADTEELAGILKVSLKDFQRVWPRIGKCFAAQGDRLIQGKVEEIRNAKDGYSKSQSEAGKNGADKRWGRHKSAKSSPQEHEQSGTGKPVAERVADGMAKNSFPTSDLRLPISEAAAAASETGWPLFAAAVRERFPVASESLINKIAEAAIAEFPPITDDNLVSAVLAATMPKQHSPALYLTTIPEVIRSWKP